MIKTRHCHRCKKETPQEVSRRISASAADHFGWWCLECKWWTTSKAGGIWIAKELLLTAGVDIDAVRVAEIADAHRCAKCGSRGAELHHWAPRAIFGPDEADHWPKDYLCKACHAEWHAKVTPQLL